MRAAVVLMLPWLALLLADGCRSTEHIPQEPARAIFYEFYSKTCPHCKAMEPVVAQFEKEHGKRFSQFVRILYQSDEGRELFRKYGITGTPTFLIETDDGKEIDRVSGEMSLEALITFADSCLKRLNK